MPKAWRFAPHDRGLVARLSREMRCSPLLAQVLVARGLNSGAEAKEFVSARLTDLHDPGLLPGVAPAADRIVSALQAGRRITIYGDYDVDGVTATSILWHCLKLAGGHVDYYIPCRLEEGYGLNQQAIRTLHEEDPQRLIVTVDCGISSLEEAALARSLGLELIITDHHTMADRLPDAACLVHPRLPGTSYPFLDLCGAGVAFKLAWAVCQKLGDGRKATPAMRDFLVSAVGLAAIGTIADVVPLVGENRIIVRHGLTTLHRKSIVGLALLMKAAGLDETAELKAEDIGFALAPRLNAAGRLGQARLAVELLTTENRDRARQLAEYVDQLNKSRQTVERKIFKQAKEMVEERPDWQAHRGLVLAHSEWHPGVIGIVATRIAQHFERPAVMIAIDEQEAMGQGSARSYAGFDLYAGLSACSERLVTFGGHKAAAGLRVRPDAIDEFREEFARHVADHHHVLPRDQELHVDAEVTLAELSHGAVKELEQLGPFGSNHERPKFAAAHVELVEPPRKIGNGERHLSLRVRQLNKVLKGVAFGRADWADEMAACRGPISICFTAGINCYRGYESVELQLIDWQPAGDARPPAAPEGASAAQRMDANG